MTATSMGALQQRLLIYMESHTELPKALEDLPARKGYNDNTVDGWGGVILFERIGARSVRLTSFGRDGRPGGLEDDADMVREFVLP